ncbi:MAG: tyrosine-type recombinase/integrase [Rhodothermales bacterium]|jgi:site-specific recombinase XerD
MPGPPLKLSVAELDQRLEEFAGSYLRSKSPETVGTYRRALNEFQRWFAVQRPKFLFRVDDIESYKEYLMKTRGLHQVSVSTYLTALRRFAQYLVDVGLLDENPARAVKGNRRPSTHSRAVLTEDEIDRLFRAVDTSSPIGLRDEAIIFSMLYAGLSEIEIVRANVEDLEQTLLGWYLRVQGKGHQVKDQQVVLDPPVMSKIRTYLDTRTGLKPADALFVSHGHRSEGERLNTRSVRSRIRHHLMIAKIKRPGVTPHSLTHTAALIWLNDGLSVEEVKERMRHGTLDTTMIYLRKKGLLKRRAAESGA